MAQSAELQNAVQSAFTYSETQRFNDALRVLNQVSEPDREHYLYDLTRARILTWSQNFTAAELVFEDLLAENPENPDILVPYGYLQLFDGNLQRAEQIFGRVVLQYPNYQDAYAGLVRAQNLQKGKRSLFESGYQVIENLAD